MPKARAKARAKSNRGKSSRSKSTRSKSVRNVASPTITIYSDGTYSPPTGVEINPGGVVKFDVEFPAGNDICIIPFGAISFGTSKIKVAPGTVKVGS